MDAMGDDKKRIYFAAVVTYVDVFGEFHKTRVCCHLIRVMSRKTDAGVMDTYHWVYSDDHNDEI